MGFGNGLQSHQIKELGLKVPLPKKKGKKVEQKAQLLIYIYIIKDYSSDDEATFVSSINYMFFIPNIPMLTAI